MMKRFVRFAFSLLLLMGAASAYAQSMSDSQVLEYVQSALQQGTSQNEIMVQLLSRGVTQEQALRVKEMYQQQMGGTTTETGSTSLTSVSRKRQLNTQYGNLSSSNLYYANAFRDSL